MTRNALFFALCFLVVPIALANPIDEDRAIALVSKRPEVKHWQRELARTKGAGKAAFMVTHEHGRKYTVKLSEDLSDRFVTFKIYDVDLKTGNVTAEF